MPSQLFRNRVPNSMLFEFLELICTENYNIDRKVYIINIDAYKRSKYKDVIVPFIESLKPFYHLSKQMYVERKLSYTSFTTIIRQICKHNNIEYKTSLAYDKNQYEISYILYPN